MTIKSIITIIYVLVLGSLVGAQATQPVPERTLDSLRQELLRVDQTIKQSTSQEQNLLQEMDAVQKRLTLLEQMVRDQQQQETTLKDSIRSLETVIDTQEDTLSVLGTEILALEDEETKLAGAVARSMLANRRLSDWALLEFLIGAHTWPELLARRSVVSRLEITGRRSLAAMRVTVDTLKVREDDIFLRTQTLRERQNRLNANRQQALALGQTIQKDLDELADNRKWLQSQLKRVRKDRRLLSAQRDDLESAQQEIENIINKVARGEPLSGVSLSLLKGALPWPVDGRIVQKFGMVRNRDLATLTENPGIELEADPNAVVTAVAEGKVSSVSWLRGFGNVCIIEHPGSYYTVYAKLGQVLVTAGQDISMSGMIGYPGFDAASGTYRMHFEIWSGKTKKDPLQWLKQP